MIFFPVTLDYLADNFQPVGGFMKNLMLTIAFLFVAVNASAQEAASSEPVPQNFVFLRAGGSSPFLASYNRTFSENKVVWVGGLVDRNSTPVYQELQAGVGQSFGASQAFVLALKASDGWYLQLVGVPSLAFGKVTVSAFVAGYVPLEEKSTPQFLLDPATVSVRVADKLAVGVSYTLWKPAGGEHKHAVGPAVQLSLPKGSLNIDFFKGLRKYRSEIRATYLVAF